MANIHLLIGDELVLKDLRINEIINKIEDYELKTIYIDNYKNQNCSNITREANTFLTTFNLFGNSKVLKIVLTKPEHVNNLLSKINDFNSDNCLIIDLRCPEFLVKNEKFFAKGMTINIEKFFKFKDYETEKVYNYIQNYINTNNLKFETEYDVELLKNYIFNNSLNSYSFIHYQLNKIKLLNKKILNFNDITFISGGLPDKNSYKICDYMFKCKSLKELLEYLEEILNSSNSKMFAILLNTLIFKLNDYILFDNSKMCKLKSNYYTFKNSKFNILHCNHLILKLNKLIVESSNKNQVLKEEFFLLIIEHFHT